MASTYGQSALVDRMVRAAKLDVQVYEEVEHDLSATGQALTVVALAALSSGLGEALSAIMAGRPGGAIAGFVAGLFLALLGWALGSFLVYFIGTRVFGGVATWGEVLRTVGFANAPGVLQIVRFIPVLGGLVLFVTGIWVLVCTVVAIRQALDVDTIKAVLTAIIAGIAYFFIAVIFSLIVVGPFVMALGGR